MTLACGGSQSAGPEGSACDPATQTYGCHSTNRMVCLGDGWHVEEECPDGWRCRENKVELPNGTVLVESTECYGTTPPSTGNSGATVGENIAAFCDKANDCCGVGNEGYLDCLESLAEVLEDGSSAACEQRFQGLVDCSVPLSCADFCQDEIPDACETEFFAFMGACGGNQGNVDPPPTIPVPVDPGEDMDTEPMPEEEPSSGSGADSGSGGDSE
ncbi:MAG: hypothetical protein CMH54_08445 [Myxococcales bacterium]|nr:hypothetical protein [Myxococcales bacterium]